MGYFIETKGCLKKVTEIFKKIWRRKKEEGGWRREEKRRGRWEKGEGVKLKPSRGRVDF